MKTLFALINAALRRPGAQDAWQVPRYAGTRLTQYSADGFTSHPQPPEGSTPRIDHRVTADIELPISLAKETRPSHLSDNILDAITVPAEMIIGLMEPWTCSKGSASTPADIEIDLGDEAYDFMNSGLQAELPAYVRNNRRSELATVVPNDDNTITIVELAINRGFCLSTHHAEHELIAMVRITAGFDVLFEDPETGKPTQAQPSTCPNCGNQEDSGYIEIMDRYTDEVSYRCEICECRWFTEVTERIAYIDHKGGQ